MLFCKDWCFSDEKLKKHKREHIEEREGVDIAYLTDGHDFFQCNLWSFESLVWDLTKGNQQDFLVSSIFVVYFRLLFLVSSSITKTWWSVYFDLSQTVLTLPQRYSICDILSWCENFCQESGCKGGVGAGLMQVYIAHAAPFGYWGRLDNAKDDKKYIEQFYI